VTGPVPCPRKHYGGRGGQLYAQPDGLHYVCSLCRHIWVNADVDALVKARARKPQAAMPEPATQLPLEDHHA
jgi:hypothetical protein